MKLISLYIFVFSLLKRRNKDDMKEEDIKGKYDWWGRRMQFDINMHSFHLKDCLHEKTTNDRTSNE